MQRIIVLITALILASLILKNCTHESISGVVEDKRHDDSGLVYMVRYTGIGHTITPIPEPEKFYLKINGKWVKVSKEQFIYYDKGDYYEEQNEKEEM